MIIYITPKLRVFQLDEFNYSYSYKKLITKRSTGEREEGWIDVRLYYNTIEIAIKNAIKDRLDRDVYDKEFSSVDEYTKFQKNSINKITKELITKNEKQN